MSLFKSQSSKGLFNGRGTIKDNVFNDALVLYSTQDSRNTVTWQTIDRVEGEVLGEELVVDGVLSVTPADGEVYKQVLTDDTTTYFIGDSASTIDLLSIKQVTSYSKIIGTASVAIHKDISGNGNDISQDISTMQCEYDSELGTWSWDGTAQEADVTLTGATWVYPETVTLTDGVLKLGQNTDGTLKAETLYGLAAFSRTPTTLEQARIAQWYSSLDPIQRQITYVTASVDNAVEWQESQNIDYDYDLSDAYIPIYNAMLTSLGYTQETITDTSASILTDNSDNELLFITEA